jgi:catechol 2,3-dioxygenase-like lactoylglutathione lyase family enzyme
MTLDVGPCTAPLRVPATAVRRLSVTEAQQYLVPSPRLRLQNVDHLALNTTDMRKTIDFYTRVLEMRLVAVTRTPPDLEKARLAGAPPHASLRHYFFELGGGGLLGFFEYPPGTPRGDRDCDGTMQHVAFLASFADLARARAQLERHGVPYVGPLEIEQRWWSLYFFDPNGIRLEITAHLVEASTDRALVPLQTEAEVRAELRTLYDSEAEIDRLIADMPLLLDAPGPGSPAA